MNYEKKFAFLNDVCFPVAVCTDTGRLVFKNMHTEHHLKLPKNGVSIESVAYQVDGIPKDKIHFRKMRGCVDIFQKAVVLPVFTKEENYHIWLFDIAFQFVDEKGEEEILLEFADMEFDLECLSKINSSKKSRQIIFCRFCDIVFTSILRSMSQGRAVALQKASRNLMYSASETMTKFGLDVSLEVKNANGVEEFVDYPSLAFSMIYILIFAVFISDNNKITLKSNAGDGNFHYSISAKFKNTDNINVINGDFECMEEMFGKYSVMLSVAKRIFKIKGVTMNFDTMGNDIRFRVMQKTFVKSVKALNSDRVNALSDKDIVAISFEILSYILKLKSERG